MSGKKDKMLENLTSYIKSIPPREREKIKRELEKEETEKASYTDHVSVTFNTADWKTIRYAPSNTVFIGNSSGEWSGVTSIPESWWRGGAVFTQGGTVSTQAAEIEQDVQDVDFEE